MAWAREIIPQRTKPACNATAQTPANVQKCPMSPNTVQPMAIPELISIKPVTDISTAARVWARRTSFTLDLWEYIQSNTTKPITGIASRFNKYQKTGTTAPLAALFWATEYCIYHLHQCINCCLVV